MEQPLTVEQVDEFRRLGFLVIEKPRIPAAELEWCRDILMRMILGGERRSEGRNLDLTAKDGAGDMTSPSVLQPSMYATELRKLSYRKTALATARQLLGADAEFAVPLHRPPRPADLETTAEQPAERDPVLYDPAGRAAPPSTHL